MKKKIIVKNYNIQIADVFQKILNATRGKKWSNEEDTFLKEHIKNMTHTEIGKELNRSSAAVMARVHDLNIEQRGYIIPYTEEEIEYVKNNYKKKSNIEIAKELNRPYCTVYYIRKRLGIDFKRKKVVQLRADEEFIKIHKSVRSALKAIGKDSKRSNEQYIWACIKGRRKTAYGYKWMYEEDYKKMLVE